MHEASLMTHLLAQVMALAAEHQARKVTAVCVRLGAWSHLSPQHLAEHFARAAQGTLAAGAQLMVADDPPEELLHSDAVLLESIAVET